MHHRPKRQERQCPCCRAFTTVGVTLPITAEKTQTHPADNHLEKLANQLRQQIFKKIVNDDLSDWEVPTEKLDWNTTVQKPQTAHAPTQEKTPTHDRTTRQSKKTTPAAAPQTSERTTKRNHEDTQESTDQKPSLPKSILTQPAHIHHTQKHPEH